MKKYYCILAIAAVLSTVPIIGVMYNHIETLKQWEQIQKDILTLKQVKDHEALISESNGKLLKTHHNLDISTFQQRSQAIHLLEAERLRLEALPPTSFLSYSSAIASRKLFLSQDKNKLLWCVQKGAPLTLTLQTPVEIDLDNLQAISQLITSESCTFVTSWDMKRVTSPTGNEVWSLQLEVHSRWF